MTALEAVKEYQYDVSINLWDDGLWYWDINGGYSSVGAHNGHENILDTYKELNEFLLTFKPFEK